VRTFDAGIVFGPEEYSFSLENGAVQLAQWFDDTRRHRYEDSLMVTESGPLVAYILSSIGNIESVLIGRRRQELTAFVEELLATHGAIHITKDSGLFEACRATGP
jgi:hypothetical protein